MFTLLICLVNPHDHLVRDLAFFVGKNVPTPFGIDLVGVVHALGNDVNTFKVGDVVFGNGDPFKGDYMATQEYALMDVNFMGRVPASNTQDEAATLPLNVLIIYIALFRSTTRTHLLPLLELVQTAANLRFSLQDGLGLALLSQSLERPRLIISGSLVPLT